MRILHMVDEAIDEEKNVNRKDVRYKHAVNVMFAAQDEFVLRARKEGLVENTPSKDAINIADITRAELEVMAAEKYLKETAKL